MEKEIKYWMVKNNLLSGHNYSVLRNRALELFKEVQKKSKRKPYIRSKYFRKKKVFLHYFWTHLFEKNPKDRSRRLKYLPCAFELIKYSTFSPEIVEPNKKDALKWYRFMGTTANKQAFIVQIKESKNGKLYFISVFPF